MPYALSNLTDGKTPAWRAIREASEATPDEVVVSDAEMLAAGPTPIWDKAKKNLKAGQ